MKYFKLYEQFINKTVQELDGIYDYFHLSWDRYYINSDNKTFTFTPRVPESPYGFQTGTREDDFTKRISLSDSIINCLNALPEAGGYETWYIYGYKGDIPNIIDTKETFKNCPIGYGISFKLEEWITTLSTKEQMEINSVIGGLDTVDISDLPIKYRDMFYACVPDANDNVEYWSLIPITMEYLGYISQEDIDDDINVYDSDDLNNIIPKHT